MEYEVYGPFEIPRVHTGAMLDFDAVRARGYFWNSLEEKVPKLPKAKGVYLFGIRAGRGMTPHYVGQARSRNGFYGEVFSPKNCNNYNKIIHSTKGTPIVLLLARPRRRGSGFSKPARGELDFLEKMLIGMALSKNEELINVHHTKYMKNICVPGVIGKFDGRRRLSEAQESLRALLGT